MLIILPVAPAWSAASEGPTRAEYVELVEPICKSATRANGGVLRGVDGMVRAGKLKLAAHRALRAARALEAVRKRLAAVERPAADAARLTKWLEYIKGAATLLTKLGHALTAEKRGRVQKIANEILHESKRANAVVVGFDFDYCRLNPARFA